MKRLYPIFIVFAAVVMVVTAVSQAKQKSPAGRKSKTRRITESNASDRPLNWNALHSTAVADTYVLAEYTFDLYGTPNPQGWIRVDRTEPPGIFFHVDDFAGLGGGDFGRLLPLDGNQSLWCGARADTSEALCNYGCLPGYGNSWYQTFESKTFNRLGEVSISFDVRYDSEAGYDYTYVEYMDSTGRWRELTRYHGISETSVSEFIPGNAPQDSTRLRFRFASDSGWSDEDCIHDTDGAVIIDNLTIQDATGTIDYQDFESEAVGATSTGDGDWTAEAKPVFGDYAGLFCGCGVLQEDLCMNNVSYLWGFFKGSTDMYCQGCPDCAAAAMGSVIDPSEQPAVPIGRWVDDGHLDIYIQNEIWSPAIDWNQDMYGTPVPGTASSALFEFDVYRDMPLCKLVFYIWHVRWRTGGCFSNWMDREFVYYGDQKDWHTVRQEISDLIDPSAQDVQLAVGVKDMSEFWGNWGGPCYCHSHGPLVDNVRLVRIENHGPVWNVSGVYLFQDNFPGDGTAGGTVRIDAPLDLSHTNNPNVVPGDSVVVTVSEANYGLDTDAMHGGAAVYLHVKDIGAAKSGATVSGDLNRWPLVFDGGGAGWTVLRMDTSYQSNGEPSTNRFCVDLNDNLYTPGDTVWFYFSARDAGANTSYYSLTAGTVENESEARSYPMEMTCLPANGLNGATDILYVDDFDGGGAQPYFDQAFDMVNITPDRYDVRSPDQREGNGPGSRVVNVTAQLIPYYKKIIWNSGDNDRWTIGDGDDDKSDDFAMLYDFLDLHGEDAGVYISGDNVVRDWNWYISGASAFDFKDKFMNHLLVNYDHVVVSEPLSPFAVGQPGSIFEHAGVPDTLVAYGGCPVVSRFDVLAATGSSILEMAYSNNAAHGAILSQDTANTMGRTARVVLSGFSYHEIRDDCVQFPTDRVEHLSDILEWLGNTMEDPLDIETGPAYINSLSQNYPNPFNPATTIRYTIEERGHVSLKIYGVAGRLVRTLVNEVQQPHSGGYAIKWNGLNDAGSPVASGIYFYKITAKNFSQTKKMLLLK